MGALMAPGARTRKVMARRIGFSTPIRMALLYLFSHQFLGRATVLKVTGSSCNDRAPVRRDIWDTQTQIGRGRVMDRPKEVVWEGQQTISRLMRPRGGRR